MARPKKKHAGGRPTVITPEVLQKLEQAFSMGCPDGEACVFADISTQTLYNYQNKNPEFVGRKEELRLNPIMLARTTVVNSLKRDVNSAWRYVERKDKSFSPKSEVDVTSKGESISSVDTSMISALTKQLNELHRGTNSRGDGGKSSSVDSQAQD